MRSQRVSKTRLLNPERKKKRKTMRYNVTSGVEGDEEGDDLPRDPYRTRPTSV
jgi:hypothetical protein